MLRHRKRGYSEKKRRNERKRRDVQEKNKKEKGDTKAHDQSFPSTKVLFHVVA